MLRKDSYFYGQLLKNLCLIVCLTGVFTLLIAQEWKYRHPRLIKRISDDDFTPPTHFSWDPESLYTAAVAYSKAGNVSQALDYAMESVKFEVPMERYLAGPREFLEPLTQSQGFKDWVAPSNIQLLHGPMLGLVSDNSAGVWVRTVDEVTLQLLVVEQGGVDTLKSPVVTTAAGDDYTAITEVTGLTYDKEYDYFVSIDGKIDEGIRSFHTYPRPNQRSQFSIGFSGGAAFAPHNGSNGDLTNSLERMWDVVAGHDDLLAFFLLGDNVYIDHPQEPDVQDYC